MRVAGIVAGLWLGAMMLGAAPAQAELGFPDYIALPKQIALDPDQGLIKEDFGQAEFRIDAAGATLEEKRGRHFARWLAYRPAAGEPKPGYYNGTEERIQALLQSGFARAGWSVVYLSEAKDQAVFRLSRDGRDIWAAVKMDAPQAQLHIEVIEVAAAGPGLVLPRPTAKPETVALKAELPYLPPWPGSKRVGEGRGDGPLDVSVPGAGGEPRLVGQGVETRSYQGPSSLSRLQFVGEMRAALLAAGWELLYPASEQAVADYGSLAAHYARDGRDIWIKADYQYGATLSYASVDLGREDWGAQLDKSCRLPLYGVFFDFDKAVLKPESDAVLTRAATLLRGRAGTKAEIQGHTDAVGGEDYNLRLSDARAASVRLWLTQHGIEAPRLSSKGYGKSRPVADNGSDEGRARNRRVELVKLGCTAK
jgi:outer membrane protein OmpA-like peptidoglycan-associated protein